MDKNDIEEKLKLYKEPLYGRWCRISNNKNTISELKDYIEYLEESIYVPMRILVGNDSFEKNKEYFIKAKESLIKDKSEQFYEGSLNAFKIIEDPIKEGKFLIIADYIDNNIECDIIC